MICVLDFCTQPTPEDEWKKERSTTQRGREKGTKYSEKERRNDKPGGRKKRTKTEKKERQKERIKQKNERGKEI